MERGLEWLTAQGIDPAAGVKPGPWFEIRRVPVCAGGNVHCPGCDTCCLEDCLGCACCGETQDPKAMGWVGHDGRP